MKLLKYRSVQLALILSLIAVLLEVMMSYFLSLLVVGSVRELSRNVLLLSFLYLVYAFFMYVSLKAKATATYYVSQDIKQRTDKWIAQLSHDVYHEKDHGERLSLYVNDVNKAMDLTLAKYFSMMEKAGTTLFVFLSLWMIHYTMALLALLSFIVMAFIPRLFQNKLSSYILGVQEAKESYLAKMRELLQGFDTFLENSAFTIFLQKSRKAAHDYARVSVQADSFTALMSACLTFTNAMITVIALGVLSYTVMQDQVATGAFLSVTALLPTFGSAVMQYLSEKEFYTSGKTLYQTKFGMINQDTFVDPIFYKGLFQTDALLYFEKTKAKEGEAIHEFRLHQLQIHYDSQHITFPEELVFRKGKKYAIIGASGCGKSSLLKVLIGQLKNYSGVYTVNAQPMTDTLFDHLSFNQTTFLFNDTIRQNIDLEQTCSDEELKMILAVVGLEQLDLDEMIQDNGKNLSGGQRQRLSIARALLRHKPIMILDEATANLDQEIATRIEEYILSKVETVMMISHHLTDKTKEKLDKIVSLG